MDLQVRNSPALLGRLHRNQVAPQDFGARADGVSLDTASIQQAIDAAASFGGTVYFAPGRYLCGTLHLRSNLTLEISSGAVLLGSTHWQAYERMSPVEAHNPHQPEGLWAVKQSDGAWYALLQGHHLENVVITGHGTLDGQGEALYQNMVPHHPLQGPQQKLDEKIRPVLINLVGCRNCEVSGLTLRHPASWTQNYLECTGLRLENLTVEAMTAWNNDGMDICSCRDVVVRGCRINSTDDGICLKSSESPVENIIIADCIIRSSANGLKFGTASAHSFRNISVANLTIFDTGRSGITLQVVDGGMVEQVTITNVTMRNVGNAIYLRLGDRSRSGPTVTRPGWLRQITISNVVAQVTGSMADAGYAFRAPRPQPDPNLLPSVIAGLPDAPIENVSLSNIMIEQTGPLTAPASVIAPGDCNRVPECRADYPEYDQFGELPAWGLFVRHARNITLSNVQLRRLGREMRPALLASDVQGLQVSSSTFQDEEGAPPDVVQGCFSTETSVQGTVVL